VSIINKSKVLFSGLGYIVVQADGHGLGASEGKVCANSDFSGEVNSHVDILRAVRTTLPYFNPSLKSQDPLDIIYCGYSNAAIYGPAIVYTLFPGNSQKIPVGEASKFNYTRMLLGGCPCVSSDFFKKIQNSPPTTLITLEVFRLLAWVLAHSSSGIMMSRQSAYNGIIKPLAIGDELQREDGNLRQLTELLLTANTLMFPPTQTDPYIPATNLLGDIRQLVNVKNAALYGSEFTNYHGWINPKIELAKIPGIPITMIYSGGDQVVSPTIANNQSAFFKQISGSPLGSSESAFTYDGAEYLDDYMGEGKVVGEVGVAGRSLRFPGAEKRIIVNAENNDKTQRDVQNIATLIKDTSGDKYLRIKITPENARGFNLSNTSRNFGRATHWAFALTWMESTYYVLK
jgi:hypothetical protein